jgi:hypothetical protein
MQLADAASAVALGQGPEYYVYYGREDQVVPMDVTHVRVHTSVRAIEDWAFSGRRQLAIVILNGELEEIGMFAFHCCTSIREILIPNAVKAMKDFAFNGCSWLTSVTLGDGLEEIGTFAFLRCISIHEIITPNAVKAIKKRAFSRCSQLTIVTLGDGLEEIGEEAFGFCTSLRRIVIPAAVKTIDYSAFEFCSNLTCVKFCDEIEKFVPYETMQLWWNQGSHTMTLSTYCFLVRCGIPKRLSGLAMVSSWQANIHDMLRGIPTITDEGMSAYFDAIDSKITAYEHLLNEATSLFPEQFTLDYGIVQNILSFL